MRTPMDFLSSYTHVSVVNLLLFVAVVTLSVRVYRLARKHKTQLAEAYQAGYSTADTVATIKLYERKTDEDLVETTVSDLFGPRHDAALDAYETEREPTPPPDDTVLLALWRGGASVDEIGTLLKLETDAVVMALAFHGCIPADVVDQVPVPRAETDPHLWPEASSSMLRHVHRTTPNFDEHVASLPVQVLDRRPHTKTKDLRSPLQLVRQDTTGYMPD